MCGICGKLEFDQQALVQPELVERMMTAISYRGPDGRGRYVSGPVGLGHTRLAIIDLGTGSQPMSNEDETVWVVYNGEIYNFQELRKELIEKGHTFRSISDTEVIVHLYEEFGVDCLSRIRGMFAFALWDDRQKVLFLARDRVGIKPLYYANTGRALVFGSEIKALLVDVTVTCELEEHSVDTFLTHLCLPGKETLWRGISKLEPGHLILVRDGKVNVSQYWDLCYAVGRRGSLKDASEETYARIRQTVREHMISDVPVGLLLSGGVDSTAVLSCVAAETGKRVSTFTVGFDDAEFEDERPYARIAANYFGTDHHEITFGAKQFWDFLPSLVWHMEEPVCDPPAVSLHYVSNLARKHVTVLLSGEGGDEAFGGYCAYRNFLILERAKALLFPGNRALAAALNAAGRVTALRRVSEWALYSSTVLQDYYYSRVASPFSYFNRNKAELYTRDFLRAAHSDRSLDVTRGLFRRVRGEPLLNQMQYIDTKTSLPEDLLIKADRITMGNSLELRVPLLDHALLEYAASLPPAYRVNGFSTKRVLKRAFRKRIPREIILRRKAGFPLPLKRWMQRELKNEVRDVLLGSRLVSRGYFKKDGVEKLVALGDRGEPVAKEIFALVTLELLLQRFLDK